MYMPFHTTWATRGEKKAEAKARRYHARRPLIPNHVRYSQCRKSFSFSTPLHPGLLSHLSLSLPLPLLLLVLALMLPLMLRRRRRRRPMPHGHPIRIGIVLRVPGDLLHRQTRDPLGLADGTLLVREQQRLEPDDFLPELRHRRGQRVVLRAEDFDFLLEVGEPLFFALAAFKGGDSVDCGG